MLKRIGLPLLALAAMFAFMTPTQASAAVRFGVYFGGPAYVAPAPAPYAYPYAYAAPAPCPPRVVYTPAYVFPRMYYGRPYVRPYYYRGYYRR